MRERVARGKRLRVVNGKNERQCYQCFIWKPLSEYAIRRQMGPNGPIISTQSACRECNRIKSLKYKRRQLNSKRRSRERLHEAARSLAADDE